MVCGYNLKLGFILIVRYRVAFLNSRTPEVLEFQKNLPSVAHKQHLQEIKDQFDNVADEKTVEIHKRLEELIKFENN